jgi:predicted RNA-binding protein YlxR (DUF448 family)
MKATAAMTDPAEGRDQGQNQGQIPVRGPVRRCIATGDTVSTDSLVRFVVGPGSVIFPDLAGELPGRGIWVGGRRNLLELAVKKRLFARAAKKVVSAAEDLPDQVDAALARRCLALLGLAKRAGQLTLGYEKVRAMLLSDGKATVVTARDGSLKGRQKLLSGRSGDAVVGGGNIGSGRRIIDQFIIEELSLALGGENVVHAALRASGLADRFIIECRRLKEFRNESVPPV